MDKQKIHPNNNFEEKYGSLSDPNSIISNSPFLLVRHSISTYNVAIQKAWKIEDEKEKHEMNKMSKETLKKIYGEPEI